MKASQKSRSNIPNSISRATDLDRLINGYQLCARSEGKSLNTIRITITAIRSFLRFLRSRRYSTSVLQIDAKALREYILYLQQVKAFIDHPFTSQQKRGLSGHSVNCYLRAIRAFWSWLIQEELISHSPFSKIKIPKPPNKVIPTFSDRQIQALLRTINVSNPIGFRDHAVLLLLLDTGMRAGELVGITLEDLNLDEGMIKLFGKGSKERTVPIGNRVQRAIWKYLQFYRREPFNPLCATLFLSKNGDPLTVNGLQTIVEKYGRKACIQGVRCSPHTLRHTFAISYLRNGGDVFSLQRILGHSSLEIVRLYVNLAEIDIKSCHRKYSPIDNLDLRQPRYKRRTCSDL